jgi:uncharacterized protein (TIGR00369 family)
MLQTLNERQECWHPHCVVCSRANESGLQLRFTVREDGSVEAQFHCQKVFEGFAGCLHGGVVSSLLDGAMANCLFAHGHVATTGELTVRFRRPVVTGEVATVRAWVERSSHRLHLLRAEVLQGGAVKASGLGRFVVQRHREVPRSGPKAISDRADRLESRRERAEREGSCLPTNTNAWPAKNGSSSSRT